MEEIIRAIEKEITSYRQQEEIYRIKRETLEQLLVKIKKKPAASADSPTPSHVPILKKVGKRVVVNTGLEVANVVVKLLSDGNTWGLSDILKSATTVLGRPVAESTLRYAINKDPRIEKKGYGVYCLSSTENARPENLFQTTLSGLRFCPCLVPFGVESSPVEKRCLSCRKRHLAPGNVLKTRQKCQDQQKGGR